MDRIFRRKPERGQKLSIFMTEMEEKLPEQKYILMTPGETIAMA